jgi:hypothetical protein
VSEEARPRVGRRSVAQKSAGDDGLVPRKHVVWRHYVVVLSMEDVANLICVLFKVRITRKLKMISRRFGGNSSGLGVTPFNDRIWARDRP